MATTKKLMGTTAVGGGALAIEDVFSTYLYTGNGGAQIINNGIALGNFGVGSSTYFNGSTDYLSRSSDLTGNTNSKTFTFSAWVFPTASGVTDYIIANDGVYFRCYWTGSGFSVQAKNAAGTTIFNNTAPGTLGVWNHVLVSVDLSDTAKRWFYVNEVLDTSYTTYTNDTIDFTRASWTIAAAPGSNIDGYMAHVYLDYTYRDMSIEANRRIFIDANGGSTSPSSLAALNPILYVPMTEDYSVGQNIGTGGDFTSNGSPTIKNVGTEYVDGAGEGGLVWIKNRSGAYNNYLVDTERGALNWLSSNTTSAQDTTTPTGLNTFNSDGFNMDGIGAVFNASGQTYASWTFRKAPRFFDVVTYTGDGVAGREIAHNLGCEVGFMVVKCTSTTGDWYAYHRTLTGAPETDYIFFNQTGVSIDNIAIWNDTLPTSTHFTLGTNTNVNGAGKTFVAYLFAHDPLGPSGDGSDGLIACGTAGTNGTLTDLGWEPQWLLLRNTSSSGSNWIVVDNMRGVPTGGLDKQLNPNLSAAETDYSVDLVEFDPRGFIPRNAQSFRYIAIRRGPMRQPESGTEVFAIDNWSSSTPPAFRSGFPVDSALYRAVVTSAISVTLSSRLTGARKILTSSTAAEVTESADEFDYMDGWKSTAAGPFSNYYSWMFRRAPGFFDVVTYTGDGVAGRTVSHNLGVAPEMMIIKRRDNSSNWFVFFPALGSSYTALLNSANASANYSGLSGTPTATSFDVTGVNTNTSTATYIAYLFASLDGISKVGSYTGNGSTQTIDCGFTSGARFILIKRTDSTGDWYVWDTARGIVAANDPHLSLNTTAAEVTTDDSVDPDSSGFIVNQVAATNINVSSASYIFYAVA